MRKTGWNARSAYAQNWLIGFGAAQIILTTIAATNPLPGMWPGEWQSRDVSMALSMFLLPVAAFLMHRGDTVDDGRGWGFRAVYRHKEAGDHQHDEQRFVGAVLSAESIRAAMTALLLAILIENRKPYLHPPDSQVKISIADANWYPIPTISSRPAAVFYLVVIGTLALSVVTTMAGLLCYEYATRFVWKRQWPKENLLWKGHKFGTVGFYCLMWSLGVAPVLMDYQLALLSITTVFFVMWLYYFFPVHEQLRAAKLIIIYKALNEDKESWEGIASQMKCANKLPHIRCVEVCERPVTLEGGATLYDAVALLSFNSLQDLTSAMASKRGVALKSDLEKCGAIVMGFQERRV